MSLPVVEILYCRQCRWLLRAAWMAQELLSTFEEELGGVTLRSGTGGVHRIGIAGHQGMPPVEVRAFGNQPVGAGRRQP